MSAILVGLIKKPRINKYLNRIVNPKVITLLKLKGFTEERLQFYAKDYAKHLEKNKLIKSVYQTLIIMKENGYKICVVSGGYELYLSQFKPDLVDYVIGTKVKFAGGVCLGRTDGLDCLSEEKVRRLLLNGLIYEQSDSVAYSDSESDIPLFEIAAKKVVVSKHAHKKWVEKYEGYEELIW